jgi:hypothetical protein
MKSIKSYLSLLLVAGVLGYTITPLSAQEVPIKPGVVKKGVISAVAANRAGTFCHLKFPAIKPETLASAKPELQDPKTGEIVDFYGPCDHDPLGYDEVCRQKVVNSKRTYCD